MAIEDTMAQLANSQVTQSMPSLRDYIEGFQLITSNEENNAAIGVEIGMLGNTCIYIPAIYRNGKIYDMDIMYIPEMDQWIPSQDNWVSMLKSKKPDMLAVLKGRKTMPSMGGGSSGGVKLDLPFNMISKLASETGGFRKLLEREGNQRLLKSAGDTLLEVLLRDDVPDSFGVPEATEFLPNLAKQASAKLLTALKDEPTVYNAFARYYSDEELNALIDKLEAKTKFPTAQTPVEEPQGTVKILTSASTESRDLDDVAKAKILRDGAVIQDTRGLIPTKVYKAKQNNEWTTVSSNGLYELLNVDGTTTTAYVVLNTKSNGNNMLSTKFVIPVDDGKRRAAYCCDAAVVGQPYPFSDLDLPGGYTIDQIKTMTCSDCSDIDADSPASYVDALILDVNGSGFKLHGRVKNAQWVRGGDSDVLSGCNLEAEDISHAASRDADCYVYSCGDSNQITTVVKLPHAAELRVHKNTLYVPDGCKLYPIAQNMESNVLKLVDLANAPDAIGRRAKLLGVKVFNADGVHTISDNSGREFKDLNKTAAEYTLVKEYAIEPAIAEAMVKEASAKRVHSERYLLKIAEDTEFSMAFAGQNPIQWEVDVADMGAVMPPDVQQTIERASDAGVKDIFDVSLLKMLAEDSTTVRLVQEYIPTLYQAMDRVARLLYLTRAGDSMAGAYGEGKIDVLEQKLKKLVTDIGDLIIYLQQGRIDDVHDLLEGPLANTLG
jgi:hypothetical protein